MMALGMSGGIYLIRQLRNSQDLCTSYGIINRRGRGGHGVKRILERFCVSFKNNATTLLDKLENPRFSEN